MATRKNTAHSQAEPRAQAREVDYDAHECVALIEGAMRIFEARVPEWETDDELTSVTYLLTLAARKLRALAEHGLYTRGFDTGHEHAH